MNELMQILQELRPDVNFQEEEHLIDDGILTSLDVMQLSMELDDAFSITLTPLDLMPENFQSAAAIQAMVERLQAEG